MMVDIILVNWKGWRDTIECLESVFRLNYPQFRVIVVDNNSADGSVEKIKEWAEGRLSAAATQPLLGHLITPAWKKPIVYLEYDRAQAEAGGGREDAALVIINSGANLGFAGGNNVGLRYAMLRPGFGYAWLLNNDTVVEAEALSALVRRGMADPDVGIVGSTLLFYSAPDTVQAYGGAIFQPSKAYARPIGISSRRRDLDATEVAGIERDMRYVIGASMLISERFLREVGLMEEGYFLYYEELDWACRGKAFKLAYAKDSVVYHKVGQSAGTESVFSLHFLYRSRVLFIRRHFPRNLFEVYLSMLSEAARALLKGRPNVARAVMKVFLDAEAWPAGVRRPDISKN